MRKYICPICGYIYDVAIGDFDRGISPGTKWEDVLDSWNLCRSKCIMFQPFKRMYKTVSHGGG